MNPCIREQHGESYRLSSGLPACCVTRYRDKHDKPGQPPGPQITLARESRRSVSGKRGRKRTDEMEIEE